MITSWVRSDIAWTLTAIADIGFLDVTINAGPLNVGALSDCSAVDKVSDIAKSRSRGLILSGRIFIPSRFSC